MNLPRSDQTRAYSSDGWDIEPNRENHASENHWDLQKQFMERWEKCFPENRLACVARLFADMKWLGSPNNIEAMQDVAGVSVDEIKQYRSFCADIVQRAFHTLYIPIDGYPMKEDSLLNSTDIKKISPNSNVDLPLGPTSIEMTEDLQLSLYVLEEQVKQIWNTHSKKTGEPRTSTQTSSQPGKQESYSASQSTLSNSQLLLDDTSIPNSHASQVVNRSTPFSSNQTAAVTGLSEAQAHMSFPVPPENQGTSTVGTNPHADLGAKKALRRRSGAEKRRYALWCKLGFTKEEAAIRCLRPLAEFPEFQQKLSTGEGTRPDKRPRSDESSLDQPLSKVARKDLDNSTRSAHSSAAVAGYPKVGIIDNMGPMTEAQLELVQEAIVDKLPNNLDGPRPGFRGCSVKAGWLCITCLDMEAKEWLYDIISSVRPWDGASLRVVDEEDFPKMGLIKKKIIVTCWINEQFAGAHPDELHRRMVVQNEGIDCKSWRLLNSKVVNGGRTLCFAIDTESFRLLQQRNFKLFLNLSTVTFRCKLPKTAMVQGVRSTAPASAANADQMPASSTAQVTASKPAKFLLGSSSAVPKNPELEDLANPQPSTSSGSTSGLRAVQAVQARTQRGNSHVAAQSQLLRSAPQRQLVRRAFIARGGRGGAPRARGIRGRGIGARGRGRAIAFSNR